MQDSAALAAQTGPAAGGAAPSQHAPSRPPKAAGASQTGGASQAAEKAGAQALTSQLICRVRPCERPSPLVLVSEAESRVEVAPDKGHPGEPLLFDHVLNHAGPGEQEALFALLRPAILGGLHGQSSTIVAYGGPQSGKTYALSGFFTHTRLHGVAPRGIQLIVDSVERDPANSPVIEASFFELGQDAVYDLVPAGQPKMNMHESSQPPYAILDDRLTVVRCDGQAGYNRLLDTYFTGLEHVRKGAHICFQITFVHEDRANRGKQVRSHLRFVEMAWPRQHMSAAAPPGPPGAGAGAAAPKPGAALALAHGRAAAVLDQVLQCKLEGSGDPPYRNSPLVLLLKPCFEGGSLLHFMYCLRLEHSHLASLALAAPLLAKLHLWRTRASGSRELSAAHRRALPSIVARAGLGNLRVVPPLQLQAASGQGAPAHEPAKLPAPANDVSTDRSSSCSSGSSTGRASAVAAESSAAISRPADADAGAGAHEAFPGQAAQQAVEPSIQDICTMRDCAMLLEVKQRSTEMLRADAERSASVLQNLESVLGQLRAKREACGDGPSEKETNLRLLYEKVSRSLGRTNEEIRKMYEDIETIARFCEGGSLPPIYDSYNVTECQVQTLLEHMAHQAAGPVAAGASCQGGAQPQRPPPVQENVVVIPQLPLALLPQEMVDVPQQAPKPPGAREQLSPSSASSCSDSEVIGNASVKGLPAGAGTPLQPALDVGRSPAAVARTINYAPHLLSLPHTPPVPAAPTRAVSCQPAIAQSSGQAMIAQAYGGHLLVPSPQLSNVPCISGGGTAGVAVHTSFDYSQLGDESTNASQHLDAAGSGAAAAGKHTVLPPPHAQELHRSSSSLQMPGQQSLHVQLPPDVGTGEAAHDGRLRKSNSSTSMRSLGTAATNAIALSSGVVAGPPQVRAPPGGVAAASPIPPAFASPLLGHRATLSGQSPMRSSFTSASAGSSVMTTAATGSSTLAQSQSMSALPGSVSPLLQPKRNVLPAATRAPPRHAPSYGAGAVPPPAPGGEDKGVVRQSTPVPQPAKGAEVRARGSTGSAAQAHSPSPVMMRRSVSTQALRVERGAPPSRMPYDKSLPRSSPGGPSPERQRPGGPGGVPPAVSPMRSNWSSAG